MNIREEKLLTMLGNVACQIPQAPPTTVWTCPTWIELLGLVHWLRSRLVLPGSCHPAIDVKCQSPWAGPCLQVAELRILQGSWREVGHWAAMSVSQR